MKKEIEFITKTSLLLALALVVQIGLAPFAQPVVGPLVNMILLLAVLLVGPGSAITVGILTPVIAFLVGIMGLLPILPIIMLGNGVYALVFWKVGKSNRLVGVLFAAAGKFIAMTTGVRIVTFLFLPNLPAPVAAALSFPQLYTALLGGSIGLLVYQYLPKRMGEAR